MIRIEGERGESNVLAVVALLVAILSLLLSLAILALGGWAYFHLRAEVLAPGVVSAPAAGSSPSAPNAAADIPSLEARTAGAEAQMDETWGDLGDAYLAAGRRDDAIRAYRRAYELDASDSEWSMKLRNLGDAAFIAERDARRIPELESRVAGADARNDETWGDLGDAYRETGRRDDAIRAYRKARELDPDDSEWSNALQALGAAGNP